MARIIYKEGLEGQNTLESIEGIEIELLNGQKALIYPKYAERQMLELSKIKHYDEKPHTEIEALREVDSEYATKHLLYFNSPASEFVHKFYSDKYGRFHLPTLLSAMELQYQKKDIDYFAATIEGADLLQDFTRDVWSCSAGSWFGSWVACGNRGLTLCGNFQDSYLAVPVVLYR